MSGKAKESGKGAFHQSHILIGNTTDMTSSLCAR